MQTEQLSPSPSAIAACAERLREGQLAILPTDTVYGIVADVRRDAAVRALYSAKGKGADSPLQLLFAPAMVELARFARLNRAAEALMQALGPGGWTIIVPAAQGWTSPALAGGRTVGLRIPDAPVVHAVVHAAGAPLAASSANRHGGPSPTTCAEAVAQIGEHCAIAIDAGPTVAGLDSTIIDCAGSDVRILREGAIDRATVARILGLSDIPVLRSVRP